MKILLICRDFHKKGGISRYSVELAERFVKKYETHLLTTDYKYKIPDLMVHTKPVIRRPFWLQILSNTYYNTEYAKELKRKLDIDIVSSNGAESLFCDVLTMHSCHKAWVSQYRLWSMLWNLRGAINPLNNIVLNIEKRMIEKGSKKIISVSEGVKREILAYYNVPEEKITVIPNGVNTDEFKPTEVIRERTRKEYGIEDDELALMFCGHEFRRKGLKYIIRALPKLEGKVKLIVVGKDDSTYYKRLASKLGISDKVIFTGFVPRVTDCYTASDIFVFPTAYEACPLAAYEAAASGLPILATKVSGIEELIEEGNNGFFIEREPENIAEKINILIMDESLRKLMSKNARKTAERYSWDKMAGKTLEVFEQIQEENYSH